MALTRDQIMRGANLLPDAHKKRGQKGAKASPWSKGRMIHPIAREHLKPRAPKE